MQLLECQSFFVFPLNRNYFSVNSRMNVGFQRVKNRDVDTSHPLLELDCRRIKVEPLLDGEWHNTAFHQEGLVSSTTCPS